MLVFLTMLVSAIHLASHPGIFAPHSYIDKAVLAETPSLETPGDGYSSDPFVPLLPLALMLSVAFPAVAARAMVLAYIQVGKHYLIAFFHQSNYV
jgi:hypothetical protein